MVERGDTHGLTDKHPQRFRLIGRSQHFKVLVSLKGAVLHPEGKNADNHQTVKIGHDVTECTL